MITDEFYGEYVADMREELNKILDSYPFELRRKEIKWKQVLDKDKKPLNKSKMHIIANMDTEHLRNILLDSDYDNSSNYDLILRTIWEEYHYRKNNHLC